jgi:hypothetical protein
VVKNRRRREVRNGREKVQRASKENIQERDVKGKRGGKSNHGEGRGSASFLYRS